MGCVRSRRESGPAGCQAVQVLGVCSSSRQSRPCHVQMQASLPSGSANTQNAGAASSDNRRPPAAIAASILAPAASCGTSTSMWIRLRCGRGASICWNQISGPRPSRVDQRRVQFGPRFVCISRNRLPERPHQRDVERVDGDFERLHSTRPRLPSPGCQCPRHVVRQPNVAPGDPGDVGGLQPQHGPVRADVDGQMSLSVGADRGNGK